MNQLKRYLAVFLAVLMVSAVLVSCNNGTTDPNADSTPQVTTVAPSATETPSELYFDMVDADGNVCYIVYPDGASEKVIELANKLSARLKTTLGRKQPPVICENEVGQYPGNYICIGNVNVAEGMEYLSSLKYADIGYKVISSDILCVSAHTDEYLEDAIKMFWNTFSKSIADTKTLADGSSVSGRFYPASSAKTKHAEYKAATITLDGVDISNYKMIYASDADKKAAYALRNSIGNACGVVLPIAPQTDTEVVNEILVGLTDRALSKKYEATAKHNYRSAIESGKMVVVAPHDIMMGVAVDHVESTLLSVSESGKAIELTAENNVLGTTTVEAFDLMGKDSGDLRILSNNLYFESQTRERANTFLYTVPLYDADVICLQEMDPLWHLLLDNEIPKLGYTAVPTVGSGEYANKKHADNYTPIYYRADKYKLVDGGYQPFASVKDTKQSIFEKYEELSKLNDKQKENVLKEYIKNGTEYWLIGHLSKSYSWAILESLETGERFGVISTHMTHDNSGTVANVRRMYDAKEIIAKTEELQTKYSVEFIVTGDFNFNSTEKPYTILKNGGYADAFMSAEIYDHHYTTHKMGEMPTKDGLPIDMFFHTSGIDSNKYQIVVNDYTITYSDHIPVVFDFKLK